MPTPTPTGRVKWDEPGKHFYELGVSNGVLYPMLSGSTYSKGVAWDGLTGVTESPEGAEPNDMWADNIKYASIRSAETFGGTIEAYTYPDEFALCDGTAQPDGVPGVYLGQQARKPFGFTYKSKIGNDTSSEEDDAYKLHIIYNATASPSERAYETVNDSPDAMTFSWEFDTTPIDVAGYKPISSITIDSRKADPTCLAALEDILYGKDAVTGTTTADPVDPRLPLPAEVISVMTPGT